MPVNPNGIRHLIAHFGSGADLSRAAGTDRTTAHYWVEGTRNPQLHHMVRIIEGAEQVGLDREEAADAIGARRCPCCACFLDDEVRALVAVDAEERARRAAAAVKRQKRLARRLAREARK